MSDSDWSDLFMELTKDDMISHEIHLIKSSKLNQNHLNYVRTLLDNQFRLTSLIIIANYRYLLDASIKIELFRHLKENNFITKLELTFKMDSNVFNELINLLKNKNNLICLHLSHNSCINDEEAIMLTKVLKNNTVLRSLSLIETSIGDIGFQALLSSLPNSLSQLIVDNSRISTKSLFSLLAFLKIHSIIKYVSLKTNGISISTEINVPELMEKILKITNTNHCTLDLDINEKIKETIAKVTDGNINLCFGQLRDDHILELCNALKKQSNRNWSLTLDHNDQISSVEYHYFVIKEISLDGCEINADGAIYLAKCLPESSLEKLYLN